MIDVRKHGTGFCFNVHVTPGARKASVGGEHNGALRISVREIAEKGKANQGVIEALANALGVRRADCEVISGHTNRRKTILIEGITLDAISVVLEDLAKTRST